MTAGTSENLSFAASEVEAMLEGVVACGLALRGMPAGSWPRQWVEARDRVSDQLDEVARSLRTALTAQSASARLTVLIVDDEPDVLAVEEALLSRAGYATVAAPDGLRCLRAFETHHPDVILLDISMPGLSGWDVLREIRRTSDTPVLIVTAHAQAEADRLRGFAEGADDFIAKPYSSQELVARVQAILRRTAVSAPAQEAPFEARPWRVAVYPAEGGLRSWLLARPAFAGYIVDDFTDRQTLADALESGDYDLLIMDGRATPVDGRIAGGLAARRALDVPVLVVGRLAAGTEGYMPDTGRVALLGDPLEPRELWSNVDRLLRTSRWLARPLVKGEASV